MARDRILTMYDRFVKAVAAGRNLDEDRVRELGGGRVWMGGDAVENGLCDGVGGLVDAIARARELAGIDPTDEVLLREYPRRPLLEWPKMTLPIPGLALSLSMPSALLAVNPESDDATEPDEIGFLRAIADAPGSPRLMLTPGCLPEDWKQAR